MAKRDQVVAKWHQKQFESSNENKFVSQRAETRESKQRHKELRIKIKDKFWFDSLSFEDKQKVLSNWYFYNPSYKYWYSDPETAVIEGDSESKTITIISTGVTYTTDKSLICLTLTKPFNIL